MGTAFEGKVENPHNDMVTALGLAYHVCEVAPVLAVRGKNFNKS